MKLKIVAIISAALFLGAAGFGLANRMKYRDFNKEEAPLMQMHSAGMSQNMLMRQIELVKTGNSEIGLLPISECPVVLAVRCEEKSAFRYNCMTQKVSVTHVFRGEGLSEGDILHLNKVGSRVWREDRQAPKVFQGTYGVNMGFVNEMIPGKTYLVFLDHKVNTYRKEAYWVFYGTGILTPQFCYENLPNHPASLILDSEEEGTYVYYQDVADCEFFLLTDEALLVMAEFKESLLKEYPLP